MLKTELVKSNVLLEKEDKEMKNNIKNEVEEAYKAAIKSPLPSETEINDFVYFR